MKDETNDIIIKDILRRLHRLEEANMDTSSMLYRTARVFEDIGIDNGIERLQVIVEEIEEEREGE